MTDIHDDGELAGECREPWSSVKANSIEAITFCGRLMFNQLERRVLIS
jgi:hypothetical protein